MVGGFDLLVWFSSLYLLSDIFCISNEVLLLFVLLLMALLGLCYNLRASAVISCRVQDSDFFRSLLGNPW